MNGKWINHDRHKDTINALAISSDGQIAGSASRDKTIILWDMQSGLSLGKLEGHESNVACIRISPNDKYVITGSWDCTIRVWDIKLLNQIYELKGHSHFITDLIFIQGTPFLASSSDDYTIKIWDWENGRYLTSFNSHNHSVIKIIALKKRKQIISASRDGSIKLWDIETGEELYTIRAYNTWIQGIWITPDQKYLISSSVDSNMKIWDLKNYAEITSIKLKDGPVANAVITSDSQYMITSPYEKSDITIWNLKEQKEICRLKAHKRTINSLILLSNGQHFVSTSDDRTVKLINFWSGAVECKYMGDSELTSCVLSPDEKTIVVAEKSGSVHFLYIEGKDKIQKSNRTHTISINKQKYDIKPERRCKICKNIITEEGIVLHDEECIDRNCLVNLFNDEEINLLIPQHNIINKCCICDTKIIEEGYIISQNNICADCISFIIKKILERSGVDKWSERKWIDSLSSTSPILDKIAVLACIDQLKQIIEKVSPEYRNQYITYLIESLGFTSNNPLSRLVRQKALDVCVILGEKLVPRLIKSCKKEPWYYYVNIILALSMIAPDNKKVQKILRQASKNQNIEVRMRIPAALDHYDSKWSRRLLEEMLFDSIPNVAEQARQVLVYWDKRLGLSDTDIMLFKSITGFADKLENMPPEKIEYVLRCLPCQILLTQNWTRLMNVLTDIEYIGMKAKYGFTEQILQDYSYAKESIPSECVDALNGWEHFIRKSARALIDGHCPLFQMAYNNANMGPVAEQMDKLLDGGYNPGYPWLKLINRPKYFPQQALFAVLESSEIFINAVAIESVGLKAISGGDSGCVYIWDIKRCVLCKILKAHCKPISSIAIAKEASIFVTGSDDNTVKTWDINTGKCLSVLVGHEKEITCVAVTPDGKRTVTSSKDGTVRVWDTASGASVYTFYKISTSAIVITADGKQLIVGHAIDGSISIWEINTQKLLARIECHSSSVLSLSVTPDGRWAVSGSYDNTVAFHDLQLLKCRGIYKEHTVSVVSVAITDDGQIALSAGIDGSMKTWNLQGTIKVSVLPGHMTSIKSIALDSTGQLCVSGGESGQLKIWNMKGEDVTANEHPKYEIHKISSNLKHIILFDNNNRVYQNCGDDLFGFNKLNDVNKGYYANRVFDVSSNMHIGVSGHEDGKLSFWNMKDQSLLQIVESRVGEPTSIETMPCGDKVLVVGEDNIMEIWDLHKRQRIKSIKKRKILKNYYCFMPNNRYTIWGDDCNNLLKYDLENDKIIGRYIGHLDYIYSVAISNDCRFMSSRSMDGTLRIWKNQNQECLYSINNKPSLGPMVMSPDNRRLLYDDGFRICILDILTGRCINTLDGHSHFIVSILISPDAKYVISASRDNTMRIWCMQTGKCIGSHFSHNGVCRPKVISWPIIVADTDYGTPVAFQVMNFPEMDMPLVTAGKLWNYQNGNHHANMWDGYSVSCYWCGTHFAVKKQCFREEEIICPQKHCGKKMKLNRIYKPSSQP
jgi:WD40 repeat protein